MRVTVTGASGLIGRALIKSLLSGGHSVVALVRDPERVGKGLGSAEIAQWNPMIGAPPLSALNGVDAVVHLAGEPVAENRWTASRKALIRDSRVIGTHNLVNGMRSASKPPGVLLSGSAIGYYGSRGDELLDEQSSNGSDFLANVCAEWEMEAAASRQLGTRVVTLRTGIVLANDGGALPMIVKPFHYFAGGPLGDGRQWMSWIHIADQVGLMRHALENAEITGPLNLTAPEPVRNAVFASTLGSVLGRPSLLPAPRFALGIFLGERVDVLVGSQKVLPQVAQRSGYVFRYPELRLALRYLLD